MDLSAPGVSIYSTLPGNKYGNMSGTSMAAPFVTGVAALIKSLKPAAAPLQIKYLILNNVDTVSGLSGKCVTGGRLNAKKALNAATATYPSGAFYKNASTGQIYNIAGGAPFYVSSWDNVGGYHTSTLVDAIAISPPNLSQPYNHIRYKPADGTFVRTISGNVYHYVNGALSYVSSWDQVGGHHASILVDYAALGVSRSSAASNSLFAAIQSPLDALNPTYVLDAA